MLGLCKSNASRATSPFRPPAKPGNSFGINKDHFTAEYAKNAEIFRTLLCAPSVCGLSGEMRNLNE